jgi:hypothetical protein
MEQKIYNLKDIIETVFKNKNSKVTRRLIYNKAPIGGISSKWIQFILFLMPFVMYAAIFNPRSFEYLGIAQAIVFYIILLGFAMQIVIGVAYFNNRSVVKKIRPSWEHYFPDIDLKMILSSGVTPYVDFMKHYESTLDKKLDNNTLHEELKKAFVQMKDENKILIDSMNRDKKNKAGK